ncbi:MAG: NADH-quinone oxidoreductase subunit H, partial [Planctomycetota bacterium]
MPIRWEALPKTGIDKNPTPIDAAIRRGPVMAALGLILVLTPVVLILAWIYIGRPISQSLFGFDVLQWVVSHQYSFSILMMLLVLFIIVHLCAACILAERKISAYIQDRRGPDRVGWRGLLQPIADGLKFLLKEDITPANVDKPVYILAPCISFVVALVGFAVLPWAGDIVWPWTAEDGSPVVVSTQVAPLSIGVLYLLAVGSLSPYGVVLGGWASNNKYSFYGGMRATAQMLSYEVPLGLGVLVLLLLSGSLRLEVIQEMQTASGIWNIFLHPIAFFIVLVAAFAETNRAPFDLAECEQELVGGFHTEYSSMKFALFF